MTEFYLGKICAKHVKLNGKRYSANKACPLCQKIRLAKWMVANPGKANAMSKAYNEANPEKRQASYKARGAQYYRDAARKSKYGITSKQYIALLDKQKSCCAICGINQANLKQALAIDHCHVTARIRGLLCQNCNKGLGNFKDNPLALKKAIKYLGK
jgi:hypothetical protein